MGLVHFYKLPRAHREGDEASVVEAVVRLVVDENRRWFRTEVSDRFERVGQMTATGCSIKCHNAIACQGIVVAKRAVPLGIV